MIALPWFQRFLLQGLMQVMISKQFILNLIDEKNTVMRGDTSP